MEVFVIFKKIILLLMSLGLSHSLQAERRVSHEGYIEILVFDDFEKNKHKTKYFLHSKKNNLRKPKDKPIELEFSQLPGHLKLGQKIKVNCIENEDNLGSKNKFCKLENKEILDIESSATETKGALKTLWMVVDVQDASVPLTIDQAKIKMDMTHDWFYTASFGQLGVNKDLDANGEYDIFRVTLPNYSKASNGCDYTLLRYEALTALYNQGVNLDLYKHDVLLMPNLGCDFSGLAHVGCDSYCAAWIQSVNWDLVYPHELGHNIGMHHAATDPENDDVINSEYGDKSCPMGNTLTSGYFNAPHTAEMKWASEADSRIKFVDNPVGTYSLAPMSGIEGQTLMYRFTTDKRYFLSYRRQGDFDKVPKGHAKGITLHSYIPGGKTYYIKTLAPGQELIFETFQIKSLVANSEKAEFKVSLCNLKPEITKEKNFYSVDTAGTVNLKLTVKNTQTPGCEPTQYNLSAINQELAYNLSHETVTLAPGESQEITINFHTTESSKEYSLGLQVSPNQMTSLIYKQTAEVLASRGALDFPPQINRKSYSGSWTKLPNFLTLTPTESKLVTDISIGEYGTKDNFALTFDGYIYLTEGIYTFSVDSDDGSRFYIAKNLLLDRDGLDRSTEATKGSFQVDEKGFYPIRLEYFEKTGTEFFDLLLSKDGGLFEPIPSNLLFHFEPQS
jgi:hypothetical protein